MGSEQQLCFEFSNSVMMVHYGRGLTQRSSFLPGCPCRSQMGDLWKRAPRRPPGYPLPECGGGAGTVHLAPQIRTRSQSALQ